MAVDEKVLNEKISKKEPLSKEEETAVLQSDSNPAEGYSRISDSVIESMPIEDFDKESEKKEVKKDALPKEDAPAGEVDKKEPDKDKGVSSDGESSDDVFVKLERELAKPEGKEDLKGWSDREKAYFHQMRRDRKSRQKAEADLDIERREKLRLKKEVEAKPKQEEDPLSELKKKNPTDYMTVAEVVALTEKLNKKEDKKTEEVIDRNVDPKQMRYLKMCEKEARETHPEDFDAVMELTEDIINNNPQHLTEVAKALYAGENPALREYELIKADPEFADLFVVAKTKIEAKQTKKDPKEEIKKDPPKKTEADVEKEKKATEAQEALEKNKSKPKTTGSIDSSSDTDDEPSFDALSKLSDREFAKLPKKVRARYLRQMEDL